MNDLSQGQRQELTAEQQWQQFSELKTAEDYINSLRGRNLDVFLVGERIDEPVDHPIIRPSINAMAESYILAEEDPELTTAWSSVSEQQINRFLHVPESSKDLVQKNKMQRRMGQLTGTCFQRCAGLDTLSVLFSITYDIDKKHGTPYHERYVNFLKKAQQNNLIVGAGMTDPKGDRSKRPSDQADPDLFMHVTQRTEAGLYVKGAKAHMTGGLNSHWICVMPTMNMLEGDKDYAVIGMIPATAPGLTYIYGRRSCDSRALDAGDIAKGHAQYGGEDNAGDA